MTAKKTKAVKGNKGNKCKLDDKAQALLDYTLRLGDNALILGQRLSEWTAHSPAVELDMAMTNMALDLIGQAQNAYTYAGEIEGRGHSADDLAFLRDAHEFRNLLLVEQPNHDWGVTTVRQFLISAWQTLFLAALMKSTDARLAALAEKALVEARYHETFARDWMLRLGDGTEESHARTQAGLDRLWHLSGELFAMDGTDELLLADGIAVDLAALEGPWREKVDAVLAETGLSVPEVKRMTVGGRQGRHSEYLGHLLAEMQFLQRAYPGLEW